MSESIITSIFQKANIAEINSLSLLDYEKSLNNYFSDNINSKIYQQYFKWFNNPKFGKNNGSLLKEFKNWFYDFFNFI